MSILVTFSLFICLLTGISLRIGLINPDLFRSFIYCALAQPPHPFQKPTKNITKKNTTQKTHKANHLKEISVSALEFIKRLPSIK